MTAAPPPLRWSDTLLINAVCAILCDPILDDVELELYVGIIREALPTVSRDGAMIADLAQAAEDLAAHHRLRRAVAPDGTINPWARARLNCALALAPLLRWRTTQAYERAFPVEARP